MTKTVSLLFLLAVVSLASTASTKKGSSYYLKEGKRVFKPIEEKSIKPLKSRVIRSEYKMPVIKGVILTYEQQR